MGAGNFQRVLKSPVKPEWVLACAGVLFTVLSIVEGEHLWICRLVLPIIWLFIGVGFGNQLLALSACYAGISVTVGANPWNTGLELPIVAASAGTLLVAVICAKSIDTHLRWMYVSVILAAVLNAVGGAESGPGGFSHWLVSLGFSPEIAWQITVAARKSVHFAYYGLLALTAHFGTRNQIPIWAISWTLVHAGFDEVRQAQSPGRTGTVWDVLLDFAGGATFVGLAIVLGKSRAAKKANKKLGQDARWGS